MGIRLSVHARKGFMLYQLASGDEGAGVKGLRFAWHYFWYLRWDRKRRYHWIEMVTAECRVADHKEGMELATGLSEDELSPLIKRKEQA